LRVGVAAVLGLASYYRKFVKGFANVAALLHRLLEKGAKWDWSKACQFAFDAQFIVDGDASGDRLGAVLSQREAKPERVVALPGGCHESGANSTGPGRVVMVARYPVQRDGMVILGPLEKTPSGNRCVLVLMDNFYKWTAAFPLANMEANAVAKLLVEKYIAYFGAHDYLPSDQGRSFEASVVLEMCQLFVIKKTRSFPYHPQGNVQAERFTGALLDMLSIMFN
ncbi:Retrovirus-related Pol polyprotein from transposon, partial [Trichinella britovi]